MPPVDLTSTWIPLSLLAGLCSYMFVLFQRERRMVHTFEGESGHSATVTAFTASPALAGETAAVEGGHAAEAAEVVPEVAIAAPAPAAAVTAAETPRKKLGLMWRTAYLWLPVVAGFGWQAYLDFLRAWLNATAH